jgi:hypothetical protein
MAWQGMPCLACEQREVPLICGLLVGCGRETEFGFEDEDEDQQQLRYRQTLQYSTPYMGAVAINQSITTLLYASASIESTKVGW